ncbi:DUF2399 domain-containing protein [Streptomyces sp. DH37]|uniref:DUF2399 domain-containing protein n=1 Tax=Streptomyces sp. DH37 TaxID=3040122 RepID=UPI00244157DB|nr:DUF2399 domain-containing protein [Streptomyces sp. DH37]MDG9703878.1 DUF2399 domain-containing protein [Streptomyces sp. DH37]
MSTRTGSPAACSSSTSPPPPGASPPGSPWCFTPWTLQRAAWPAPGAGERWVFVTENPSVTAAALEHDGARHARLLRTVGTPSAQELAALARLAERGWRIAARTDFDPAGLAHVRAVLHPAPYRPARLETGQLPPPAGTPPWPVPCAPAPARPTKKPCWTSCAPTCTPGPPYPCRADLVRPAGS